MIKKTGDPKRQPGLSDKERVGNDRRQHSGAFGPHLVDPDTGIVLTPTGSYSSSGTWDYYTFTGDDEIQIARLGNDPTKGAQIEALVVPGGGGNSRGGGGGGGGPAKTGTQTVVAGQIIKIVVGAGGTGHATIRGTRGSSSQCGSLFADGGGEPGSDAADATEGPGPGAGGRGHATIAYRGGLNSNGHYGGANMTSADLFCGGGAGAGAAGSSAGGGGGGAGGAGLSSSITGSAVSYGGGGGGGNDNISSAGGAGGAGGGGTGSGSTTTDATAGGANTGGGAGGNANGVAKNGGSGVVIIRVKRAA